MLYLKKCVLLVLLALFTSLCARAQSTDTFDLDQTYAIAPEGTISLKSDDAEVTIVGSDRSDVHVEVHYELEVSGFSFGSRTRFDMTVNERNGNLVLEEQPRDFSGVTFGSTSEEYTIRIEAPRGVSLELAGDDEFYTLRDINGAISIDADDADVRLTACRGDEFRFDLDDGSIEMDEGRGLLVIDVDDGEADIRNGRFDRIVLDSDDGDFNIHTRLANGGQYQVDMDDGDLMFNVLGGGGTFTIRHDNADIDFARAFRRTTDRENQTVLELEGGTAQVQIDVDDADIDLRNED